MSEENVDTSGPLPDVQSIEMSLGAGSSTGSPVSGKYFSWLVHCCQAPNLRSIAVGYHRFRTAHQQTNNKVSQLAPTPPGMASLSIQTIQDLNLHLQHPTKLNQRNNHTRSTVRYPTNKQTICLSTNMSFLDPATNTRNLL